MIDDVFIQNRLRSFFFTSEVEKQIEDSKQSLNDLGQTQIELSSKIQFIEDEKVDMQKSKDEMFYLQDRKQAKDLLAEEIQEQEARIS